MPSNVTENPSANETNPASDRCYVICGTIIVGLIVAFLVPAWIVDISPTALVLAVLGSICAVGSLAWITWVAFQDYKKHSTKPAGEDEEARTMRMMKFDNIDCRWFLHVLTGLSIWLLWLTACFAVETLAAIQQKAEPMILHRVAMVITTAFLASLCICLAAKAAGEDR